MPTPLRNSFFGYFLSGVIVVIILIAAFAAYIGTKWSVMVSVSQDAVIIHLATTSFMQIYLLLAALGVPTLLMWFFSPQKLQATIELRSADSTDIDITKQKETEEALQQSKDDLNTILTMMMVGVAVNINNQYVFTNAALEQILGYTEEEFKGLDNIEQLIHEEDRPLVHQRYTERLDGTHRHADLVEVRYRHKDGHDVWVQVSGLLITYQGEQATLATFVDITEGKRAVEKLEEALREKEHLLAEVERQKNTVLRSFIQGQEDERHRIAQDLHDGVGHLLSIVKIGLSSFQENVQALAPERLDDFQHFLRIYDQAVQEVRAVSHQLMPATLRKMGLKAALQDLATMLTLSGKIRVDVSLEALDTLTTQLDNELETSVFRIVQELANNTVKYAQARTVSIQIINNGGSLLCIYEDDGIGFDVHNVPRGLGLNNIYNRVLLLGGTAEFDSALGNGMVATIEIPVHSLLFEKAI
jgi:PAS domain S-box-containing protein